MENNQIKLDVKCAIAPRRIAYATPSLTIYGEIQDLTAGGSGTTVETNNGGIGCMGMSLNRSCQP